MTDTTLQRRRVQAARTTLILEQPFFGALALRLRVVEDAGRPTAWTDGTHLGYNPSFVDKITQEELVGVIAHEVLHCANGHVWRKDGREHRKFNYACDYAINPILKEAGFKLPDGCLLDQQYVGKSAEWIYARLPDPPKDGGSRGEGQPGSGACDVQDPAEPGEGDGDGQDDGPLSTSEADWQQAVQQAANAAKQRGKLPASLERFAAQAAEPKVDWRSVLHRFVQQTAKDDYTWRTPNQRYLCSGLFLPTMHSEHVGPIAIAIDTSGSIDNVLLSQFAAEVRSVVDDVKPSAVHVIWCDAMVHRIDTFQHDEPVEFKPVGGGGTNFAPVMDAVDEMEETPVCLVYLTDLEGGHRDVPPQMPVLWATIRDHEVPYGEKVMVGD